jgi:hypothetical protein
MFPFGSLLTQVPLVILAFAYLLYAGAAVVNKLKPCDEPDIRVSAKIQNITEAEISLDKTFFWHQDTDQAPLAVENAAASFEINVQLTFLPVCIPDTKAPYFFFGSDLFSRPPPCMG